MCQLPNKPLIKTWNKILNHKPRKIYGTLRKKNEKHTKEKNIWLIYSGIFQLITNNLVIRITN